MKKTTSRDGTTIAFDQTGQGAPVILVLGAFNDRTTGAPLAAYLARRFTVLAYDRRGRGDSGDAAAYAIDREVEDLDAVIQAAGGAAAVFGYSSGALLALAAAARGLAITRLALYEAPPSQPADAPPGQPAEHVQALASLVAAGRRGDAVEYFQRRMVGIPDEVVAKLRHAPFRPALEAMAHTLVYDATLVADGRISAALAEVRQPALAIAGGAGAPVMRQVAERLAAQLPGGRAVTIEGATHDIAPALLGPVLERFLDG
ncbi:alpha/beta fold hydrolase [Sorangium sp. So ce131]|uniref:alpha/beta fold hydrolase n=1 Tax=Sorangium sp. So ce131 TaxID=3133282 RepID=UPI003F63FBCE